jgi:hypothetical protein
MEIKTATSTLAVPKSGWQEETQLESVPSRRAAISGVTNPSTRRTIDKEGRRGTRARKDRPRDRAVTAQAARVWSPQSSVRDKDNNARRRLQLSTDSGPHLPRLRSSRELLGMAEPIQIRVLLSLIPRTGMRCLSRDCSCSRKRGLSPFSGGWTAT